VQLGSRLIELLVDTAYVHSPVKQFGDTPPDIRPAFRHCFKAAPWHPGWGFTFFFEGGAGRWAELDN